MKKLVALVLALCLALACVPALAAAPEVYQVDLPKEVEVGAPEPIFFITHRGDDYNWRVEKVTDDGNVPVFEEEGSTTVVLNEGTTDGDSVVVWDYWYDGDYTSYDGGNLHQLIIEGQNFAAMVYDFWVNFLTVGDFISTENIIEEEPQVVNPGKWYPNNTLCVAGIEFRDAKPELTKKWYNFAAIDLSQDGVQKFDLVASNMYVVGTVIVTVNGDEVTVDWKLNKQGTTDANFASEKEFLTFFSSLDAVTEVDPAKFEGPTYEFGQPYSIANDLGGDTNVLLYICNRATYCTNLSHKCLKPIYHPQYWPDTKPYIALRNAMAQLMEADTVK